MKRKALIIPLILALTLALIHLSSAENTNQETFQSRVVAEHILIGKVKNIESRWNDDGTLIYSYVTISVEKWLKGPCQDKEVTIKYIGGEVGDIGCWVSDQPSFSMDESVKVFLKREEAGEFTVVGGRQGKISLSSNSASPGYSYSGIHWPSNSLPVEYYINELGTPDTTDEFTAVQQSFQTWEDDPGSYMDYTYMGNTTRGYNIYDGYNVISWGNIDGPEGTLARTTLRYYKDSKEIIEFDTVFDEAETWSLPQYDVQNVATHEAGHTLSLNDLYDPADSEETMYGYTSLNETKKRTLYTGDIAGISYIYPGAMVIYTISTDPIGLQVEVDRNLYTTPKSFSWYPNENHTINAPSLQSGGTGVRYVYTSWSDGGARSHTITVGTSDTIITANFKTQYMLIVNSDHGSPSPPTGENWYDKGTSITAYVTSPVDERGGTRYRCTGWTGTGSVPASGIGVSVTFDINASSTITWNWIAQYLVTFQQIGSWGIPHFTVDDITYTLPYQLWFDAGSSHSFSYESLLSGGTGVQYILTSISPSSPINVTSSITITGYYKTQYYLTVSSFYGVTGGAGWYDSGSTAYARLDAGIVSGAIGTRYVFTSWSRDASGANYAQSNPITINAPKTALANWKTQYQVSFKFMTTSSKEIHPTEIKILGATPNNTFIALASYSNVWLDNVEWTAKQILWMSNNVVPDPNPKYSPTAGGTWIINCRVYSIDFTNSFKDSRGLALYMSPSSFKLVCPNGTATSDLSVGSYYLQNGTYQWRTIVWRGIDVVPSPSPTFDPTDGSPAVSCRVYPLTVYVKDYLTLAVSGADVGIYLPDGTLFTSGKSGAGGEIAFSQLPISDYKVDVTFLGLKTSAALSLTSDKTVEVRIFLSVPMLVIIAIVAGISIGGMLRKYLKKRR